MKRVRKQVKFYVSSEEYEVIRKLAEEAGLTVPSLVKLIVFERLNLRTTETSPLDRLAMIEELVEDLKEKYEQLGKEVGRIENDLIKIITRIEHLEKMLYHKGYSLVEKQAGSKGYRREM